MDDRPLSAYFFDICREWMAPEVFEAVFAEAMRRKERREPAVQP